MSHAGGGRLTDMLVMFGCMECFKKNLHDKSILADEALDPRMRDTGRGGVSRGPSLLRCV